MNYTITKNLIDEIGKLDVKVPEKQTQRFRLLDDDDEVYFEGYQIPDRDEFAPLDEVGAGYGCTALQYWNKGWQWL